MEGLGDLPASSPSSVPWSKDLGDDEDDNTPDAGTEAEVGLPPPEGPSTAPDIPDQRLRA